MLHNPNLVLYIINMQSITLISSTWLLLSMSISFLFNNISWKYNLQL